jgi:hypothetical protein
VGGIPLECEEPRSRTPLQDYLQEVNSGVEGMFHFAEHVFPYKTHRKQLKRSRSTKVEMLLVIFDLSLLYFFPERARE